jgi:hypothetical protein
MVKGEPFRPSRLEEGSPMRRASRALALLILLLAAAPGRAVDQAAIDKAIERGVAALRQMQARDGTWPFNEIGATALAGLSILFLDRLGDPADVPLIESLTVRLLAGQNGQGAWGYNCPPIGEAEVARLTRLIRQRNELKGTRELPKGQKRATKDLPREIQQQLALVQRLGPRAGAGQDMMTRGDNSNTQFATLALWAAARHGAPTDKALALLAKRFRRSQNADGSWGYHYSTLRTMPGTPAMTCAGLLGLAVGHGLVWGPGDSSAAKRRARPDPAVEKGLKALAAHLGTKTMAGKRSKVRLKVPFNLYFLWSVERVGVICNLPEIGGKDWYGWGAEILLDHQRSDGGWHAGPEVYPGAHPHVDTCFALLFLRRANLAPDLTERLDFLIEAGNRR